MAERKESHVIERNIVAARKILSTVTRLLERHAILYHLEGGTLLGIVRDRDLLPWDDDMDISIPSSFITALTKLKFSLLAKGYKLTIRKSKANLGPFKKDSVYIFRVKPFFSYLLKWVYPSHESIVLDIFVKVTENGYTYWQAKDKLMRVEERFYQSHELVSYNNQDLRVPNSYREYLSQKYGDWSIPVREWDCSKDEHTRVTPD